MGIGSSWHWMILLLVAVLVFGGSGKISSIMGDVAKGIKSFKKGLADDEDEVAAKSRQEEIAKARKTIEAEVTKPGEQTKAG